MEDMNHPEATPRKFTRRDVIKGVIAGGAVSSTGYLFRASTVGAQVSAPGSVDRLITLNVNGQQRRVDVMKQETLATTLRIRPAPSWLTAFPAICAGARTMTKS